MPEGRKLSREYVQKVIREGLTTDVLGARMPGEQRIAARAIAKERIRVGAPLQKVEQDALHLPFVVQTPHGISREVYLVHALDCAHSIPLGWKIVIGYPRRRPTFNAVRPTPTPPTDAEGLGLPVTKGDERPASEVVSSARPIAARLCGPHHGKGQNGGVVGQKPVVIALPVGADSVPQPPDSPHAPKVTSIYLPIGSPANMRSWRHQLDLLR